jgi:hypothetical protein
LRLLRALPALLAPLLFAACSHGNTPVENAAVSTLRTIASAQGRLRSAGRIDVDWDGKGEFGTFAEMTGAIGARSLADGSTRGAHIQPPFLPAEFLPGAGPVPVVRGGYCFRIFLPAGPSTSATESDGGKSLSAPVSTDLAEDHWCAYAWPADGAVAGTKTFFLDEGGQVWWSPARADHYTGGLNAPAWDAAIPADAPRDWATRRIYGGDGADGGDWEKLK